MTRSIREVCPASLQPRLDCCCGRTPPVERNASLDSKQGSLPTTIIDRYCQDRPMRPDKYSWVIEPLARSPAKVVTVPLANKVARIAWAVLAEGETHRAPVRSSCKPSVCFGSTGGSSRGHLAIIHSSARLLVTY